MGRWVWSSSASQPAGLPSQGPAGLLVVARTPLPGRRRKNLRGMIGMRDDGMWWWGRSRDGWSPSRADRDPARRATPWPRGAPPPPPAVRGPVPLGPGAPPHGSIHAITPVLRGGEGVFGKDDVDLGWFLRRKNYDVQPCCPSRNLLYRQLFLSQIPPFRKLSSLLFSYFFMRGENPSKPICLGHEKLKATLGKNSPSTFIFIFVSPPVLLSRLEFWDKTAGRKVFPHSASLYAYRI